jgi:hypothetical protein
VSGTHVRNLRKPNDLESGQYRRSESGDYSLLYATFLKRPKVCKTTNAFYRKTLPKLPKKLERTPYPVECEAIKFVHKIYGGLFMLISFAIVCGSFIFGAIWGRYKDAAVGWSVGLSAGILVIAYITLIFLISRR